MAKKQERPKTNLTPEIQRAFNAVRECSNIALLSCFFDGEPAAAIVAINQDGNGQYLIQPLFLYVTPELDQRLTDHENRKPT